MRTLYPIAMLAVAITCTAFDIACVWKGASTPHSNYALACTSPPTWSNHDPR